MRRPTFNKMDDEPKVMGIWELILLFQFLALGIIAALVGLL